MYREDPRGQCCPFWEFARVSLSTVMMGALREMRYIRRFKLRALMVSTLVVALVTGSVAAPAATADEPASQIERQQVLALMMSGGPAVAAAAETALSGTDEDVHTFLEAGVIQCQMNDDRIAAQRISTGGGPTTRAAANAALSGTIDDVRTFVNNGWMLPWQNDQRIAVTRILSAGPGPAVKAAA